MSIAKRWIIGMGCDPNRANFAKKNWAPRLDVEMEVAHDLESLINMINAKEYAVFFIAPGMCSILGGSGSEKVFKQVKAIQINKFNSNIKCVLIEDVTTALAVLSGALGLDGFKDLQPMTNDWPFID